ncbi:MAG TPA: hypothetical protein VFT50_01990 [Baekduia sp.]|nr:hypothetical protein [Baekduia sp.]
MSVLMLLDWGQTPWQTYERVNDLMGIHGDADAPEGLVDHVACADDDGLLICDVWESQEALERFAHERLGPATAQAGAPEAQPRILPVHDRLQGSATDARVLVLVEMPDAGPERYDELASHMDAHVHHRHRAVAHTAAIGEHGGMVVVDLWDSPASFEAFAEEQILPAAQQVGLGPFEPRFRTVGNRIAGRAAHRALT